MDNFKKTRNLDGSSPEPRYSHVILVSGYPVIDSNMNVQHQVARSHSRNNVRHCILVSLWCGRKDVRSRARMDRQPNRLSSWVRSRALCERVELRYELTNYPLLTNWLDKELSDWLSKECFDWLDKEVQSDWQGIVDREVLWMERFDWLKES